MPFSLNFASDFGPAFPDAYAKIINMSWSGGDIDVLVAIYADKAAADAGKVPLKQLPLIVPVAAGLPIMGAMYIDIGQQIERGEIPDLAGAVAVE